MKKKIINCKTYLWGINFFILVGLAFVIVPIVLYFNINMHYGWLIASICAGVFMIIVHLHRMLTDLFISEFYEDHVDYYWFGKLKQTLYYKDIYYAIEPGPFDNSKFLYLYYKENQKKISQRYKFDNSKSNRLLFEKLGIRKK